MQKRSFYFRKRTGFLSLLSMAIATLILLVPAGSSHFSNALAKESSVRFLILVSKKSEPYLKCERGVRELLAEQSMAISEIKSIYMNQKTTEGLKKDIDAFRPTVAVCIGTRAAFFLKEAKPGFPWVATFLIDQSIDALMMPGLLAVSVDVPIEKRLEMLCKIRKHVHAGLLEYKSPKSAPQKIQEGACKGQDAYYVVSPFFSSIETALQGLLKNQINSFLITPDPRIFNSQESVAYTLLWGLRNRIAVCGLSSGYVKNGALYALEADIVALGRQACQLAIDSLEGKTGGKTVIQHPKKLILSINLKTARRLGLKIPENVLKKAQLVIR